MISNTLAAEIEQYRIGPKIRALRKAKKLGLVQLGEHTGLSAGLLSKIERGQLVPTLPTLARIALVFGVGLEHFFDRGEHPAVVVVRSRERLRLPDLAASRAPAFYFESLDFPVPERRMEAYLAEFPPHGPASRPHQHDGVELVYVITGAMLVEVGEEVVELGQGDAVHFESATPHSYRARGGEGAQAIVVVHA